MGEICKERAVPPDQVLLCSNTMSLTMGAVTEDVCKEYRGSCIGMRFLHPVWFIDEVELSDCDYTRQSSASRAESLLKRLFFQPFFYDGCYRRRLTLQEIATYQSRQRLRCPEPMHSAIRSGAARAGNMLGLRRGCASPDKGARCVGSSPSASGASSVADRDDPADGAKPADLGVSRPDDAEPCAVCLEAPRAALLVPCGHVAMCIECADKVLHSSRAICVVCRQPIEKVLRAAPPT